MLLFSFLALSSNAQNLVNIKYYTTADGLSDNKVTSIIKDRDGFMWFGTWAGINRFDGFNFVPFKSYSGDNSSLKSNRIDDIVEDKQAGFLWVQAYDNQVYRFDKRTQQFTSLPDLLKDDQLKGVLFNKILAVVNNEVWLRSEKDGVFLINDALGIHPSYIRYAQQQKGAHHLFSNKIKFFHLDQQNNAWIGTSLGVNILSKSDGCDYKTSKQKDWLKTNFYGIKESKRCIWLAKEGKIYAFDTHLKKMFTYHITKGEITGFKISNDERELFCTTSLGEAFVISENGTIKLLGKTDDRSPLFTILESSDGTLWIESEHFGIVSLNRNTNELHKMFPYKDYHFSAWTKNITLFENNGTIWTAINGYGLGFYDKNNKNFKKIEVKGTIENKKLANLILRSFVDPSGVLWLVSDYGGIEKVVFQEYNFSQTNINSESHKKDDSEVRGLFADEESRLWLGLKSRNMYVYKNDKEQIIPFTNKIDFQSGVYAIFKDSKGEMWFGTKFDGLFKAVKKESSGSLFTLEKHFFTKQVLSSAAGSNAIYSIIEDSKKRIWAGSYGGGLILAQKEGKDSVIKTLDNSFKNYPKGNFNRIRHLAEDAKGRIWIATSEGLVIFDPNKGTAADYNFKVYRKQPGDIHSLGGNDVQFIYKDTGNRMWVLTSSGGLNLAIGTHPLDSLTFRNFSTKDGLPSDYLLSCIEDNHQNLWIATQNGLSKFSVSTHKFQNFNHYDGFTDDASFSEASCTKMPDGELVFGNTSGYLSFNPSSIRSKKINANMVFTNIQVNGEDIVPNGNFHLKKELAFADKLLLKHNQNIVTIDFSVLDFHSTEKMNYACRILGFDEVWRNTDHQRKITYTNLPPGDYVFQVKSLNDELYLQLPYRSLQIVVLPPIWKTWWAYVIYAAVLIFVFLLIQRVIYTMLKLRHGIELEKKLAELKLNFFTQISHELRTPLSLIINPVEEVLKSENLSAKGKNYIDLVLKNAQRMTRLVNQLLDIRKVQSGKASMSLGEIELIAFTQNLIGYFKDTITNRGLKVEILSKQNQINAFWDAEKIEIVIYNILANAIKFSPDGGEIKIIIDFIEDKNWCKIEIVDEGPGVLDSELETIFNIYYEGKNKVGGFVKSSGIGLAFAKELVLLHGGEIYAENTSPSGLSVAVKIKCILENDFSEAPSVKQNMSTSLYKDALEIDLESFNGVAGYDDKAKFSTILIVEDNDDLRNFMASKFASSYNVETAANGVEGLSKAIALLPELILSDIMMPKMDGIQMLNELKFNPITSHIPVILLTAKNTVETHINSLKYGADYYLPKPFNGELLAVAMQNILVQRNRFLQSVMNEEMVNHDEPIEKALITEEDKAFLQKTVKVVKEQLENPEFNIDDVADMMNMSRSGFFKKFKGLTNIPPVEFVRDIRLEKAKELFDLGATHIAEVAYAIGFNNPKYFSTCFKAKYHESPTDYLKK